MIEETYRPIKKKKKRKNDYLEHFEIMKLPTKN